MTIQNIPAQLNSNSSLGEILLAYELANAEQVAHALDILKSEVESITKSDMRAGRRARMLGEILMDLVVVDMDEVDFCIAVQKQLNAG